MILTQFKRSNFLPSIAFLHDILAGGFSWYFAFLLRFNLDFSLITFSYFSTWLWLVILVKVILIIYSGIFRSTWAYVGIYELKRIVLLVMTYFLIISCFFFVIHGKFNIPPRSVILLDSLIFFFILCGSRFFYRIIIEHYLKRNFNSKRIPVIIFGSGDFSNSLTKDLLFKSQWNIVAIIDDNSKNEKLEIFGIEVSSSKILNEIVDRFNVKHAIIAMPSSSYKERFGAVNLAKKFNLKILSISNINYLINEHFKIPEIHDVQIEDLLGRDIVSLDSRGLKKSLTDKTILVSGAGGSIGSELCRQLIKFNPKCLICLDISEFGLYKLEQEFVKVKYRVNIVFLISDIRNKDSLNRLLSKYKPEFVFHAAAYKHVPLMEKENVLEAFNNNVLGTYTFATACKKANINKFILISTDKAVNPANVMGATKRLAEMICQGLQGPLGTKFITVRFGNVLGSSGSVIPKFREQIKAGGPVTITHPNITRYFMSIPEASQLVVQASLIGIGSEIFILDMGQSIRILDLAKDMIKLSGLDTNAIKIKYTGLRPGEKLYEELLGDNDYIIPSSHEKLKIAKTKKVDSQWIKKLLIWIKSIQNKDESRIKEELKKWVTEYKSFESKN